VLELIGGIISVMVVLGIAGLALLVISALVLVGLAVLALTTSREQDGRTTSRR
jgi:D-arabinose 1-dehydrogenase-like Zn-dependent alcohol dehydrogenase